MPNMSISNQQTNEDQQAGDFVDASNKLDSSV